jgi:GR25 family glycosyltransferase involved in LPS biosynthesis
MIIYVINRDDRPERLASVREELSKQGLNAHRFKAIEGGWRGCRDSHLALLEKCKDEVSFLVLEDDCMFVNDKNPYLMQAIDQLPSNWDMFYLGGSPQKPQERYSDNLFRARDVKTTHAIFWHNREKGAVNWILRNKDHAQKWDVFLMEWIQSCFNCYLIYPMLCTQKQSKSDIAHVSDCSTIIKNYNKYCI